MVLQEAFYAALAQEAVVEAMGVVSADAVEAGADVSVFLLSDQAGAAIFAPCIIIIMALDAHPLRALITFRTGIALIEMPHAFSAVIRNFIAKITEVAFSAPPGRVLVTSVAFVAMELVITTITSAAQYAYDVI